MFSAYDVVALSNNLDLIGVMNYDYHYAGDGMTGANSPFNSSDGSPSTVSPTWSQLCFLSKFITFN